MKTMILAVVAAFALSGCGHFVHKACKSERSCSAKKKASCSTKDKASCHKKTNKTKKTK